MINNEINQTALQEFWDKISLKLSFEQIDEFVPLFYQAKEMEKEQIINAVDEGISQGYGKYIDTEWGRENDWKAEQYYNETYGGNK
jgi:hypothetical protein